MENLTTAFSEDGLVVIRDCIPEDLVRVANESVDAFRVKNDPKLKRYDLLVEGMLQRVVNLHYSISSLGEIFTESMRRGSEICDMYGNATLYTSLFYELGSQQQLHRDTPYFYSGKQNGYMGCWVALDDVDEENGALIAIKGSHKLPEPDLEKLKYQFHPDGIVPPSSPSLFDAYNNSLLDAANQAGLSTTVLSVSKGDMVIWNPSTLHGGLLHKNKQRSRRSFVMHITPKNMPMKHMDYFFHREKIIEPIKKQYTPVGDRLISSGSRVDFRHIKTFDVSELGRF